MQQRGGTVSVCWFRRDLRLEDNTALSLALESGRPVLPLFILDDAIVRDLPADDSRLAFVRQSLRALHQKLSGLGSALLVLQGSVSACWRQVLAGFPVSGVFCNADYEPEAIRRDRQVRQLLNEAGIPFTECHDHLVFAPDEVLKKDGQPYTVYTPYAKAWRLLLTQRGLPSPRKTATGQFLAASQSRALTATRLDLGMKAAAEVLPYDLGAVGRYALTRDTPALDSGSNLGPHLRFGTVGIRSVLHELFGRYEEADEGGRASIDVFIGELIWREFFAQILMHYPESAGRNFRSRYDGVRWENRPDCLAAWQAGQTGFPLVDAGMRQLAATGRMHNRVRMVCASFLCKDLLVDWRLGEAWFAARLLDYELASNVGNWQWAAGTGCDAVPYFRIFNPDEQRKKWDPESVYVRRWIPEYGTAAYPDPIVDHAAARRRTLAAYKAALASISLK